MQIAKVMPEADELQLPCGKCIGCEMARARDWTLRCHLEHEQHRTAAFATLTYNDQWLPPTLEKKAYSNFIKRIRQARVRSGSTEPIRHFGCGEYGEQGQRPHYHAILFGISEDDESLVDRAWGKGHTHLKQLTPERIAYVTGYTAKKIGDRTHLGRTYCDPDTGELYEWQPPFIQMSRRPGIGGHARKHINSWRLYAVLDGAKMRVPRFLHEAYKKTATQEEIEKTNLEKRQNALQKTQNLTFEEYKLHLTALRKHAEKTLQMKREKRKHQ